jgi:hypothetical protein
MDMALDTARSIWGTRIEQGHCDAVLVAPDCVSFCDVVDIHEGPVVLRSAAHIEGIPGLTAKPRRHLGSLILCATGLSRHSKYSLDSAERLSSTAPWELSRTCHSSVCLGPNAFSSIIPSIGPYSTCVPSDVLANGPLNYGQLASSIPLRQESLVATRTDTGIGTTLVAVPNMEQGPTFQWRPTLG